MSRLRLTAANRRAELEGFPVEVPEVAAALGALADVEKQIEARAALAAPGGPAEFSAFIKKEIDTWGEVVRATGTKPGT